MKLLQNILDYLAKLIDSVCQWEPEIDSHRWESKMEILGRLPSRH